MRVEEPLLRRCIARAADQRSTPAPAAARRDPAVDFKNVVGAILEEA